MKPLISIIIPTYNRADLIGETLDSILSQTYQNWECIIVDDDSTDNTEEVVARFIKKDFRFSFHKKPKNSVKGPGFSRNYGFKISKGEFIYWFDSDDILLKEALERRMSCFQDDVDVVIGKSEFFDSVSKEILFRNSIVSRDLIHDYYTGKVTFYVSGPLWRKAFLLKKQLFFDERITYLDDWDFNLRAIYKVPNMVILDEVLFLYRSHAHSLSKQVNFFNIQELISECYARNKHYVLLKKSKMLDERIHAFLLNRSRRILLDILINNEKGSFFFCFNLVKLNLKSMKIQNALKTTLGFTTYKIFKRGSALIK
ncbi:glycosyltransferase family 2 protein [Flavobacterium poyangense]|uniref:glycosyltransferase family 2 protein n=1 Tax=Flavobacterium poyangense TaxID=2204302 RepID=UPI0014212478|nr:glycosyltransferase family 2 protein [Flavobacterium sp. JXAS1]